MVLVNKEAHLSALNRLQMSTDFAAARAELVEYLSHDINDRRVLEAIKCIPREKFVSSAYQYAAYEDRPLPIDKGQTISQPLIVAIMSAALELDGSEKVLEVGTGSGYQAAILAKLAWRVVTVERHQVLVDKAKQVLAKLGYTNIEIHLAEKTLGWPQQAPYESIIITAAAPQVSQVLIDQLADGGRLVIPVGSRYEQDLLKAIKQGDKITTHNLGPCRFVPLIGNAAWGKEEDE